MTRKAIEVRRLSKLYRIGLKEQTHDTLTGAALDFVQRPLSNLRRIYKLARISETDAEAADIIWALKDVSFDVSYGEVLGIVGANGAGKSTLLKVLSRITAPTYGRAEIHGRIGSLLEVGTGFHPELTGRENVYLNGSILGMHKAEVARKFDEIVVFSGVERFIDTPVKRYSSGMKVRLAFAVAAHLEPEILLVDEVLAVGDVAFQKKCLGKMDDVAKGGRTVLLVSHNMEAILNLCTRAIWLDRGYIASEGSPEKVIRAYLDRSLQQPRLSGILDDDSRVGDGQVRFTGFELRNGNGQQVDFVSVGDDVQFVFRYVTDPEIEVTHATVWCNIKDSFDRRILALSSQHMGDDFYALPVTGEIVCRVPRLALAPGRYFLDIKAKVNGATADYVHKAAAIEVAPGDYFGTGVLRRIGVVLAESRWYCNSSISAADNGKRVPVA